MKKNQIKVGGIYIAKVAGKLTTVRVDAIREVTEYNDREGTRYDVTNLATNRRTSFRSAMKFRREVQNAKRDTNNTPEVADEIIAANVREYGPDCYTVDEEGNEITVSLAGQVKNGHHRAAALAGDEQSADPTPTERQTLPPGSARDVRTPSSNRDTVGHAIAPSNMSPKFDSVGSINDGVYLQEHKTRGNNTAVSRLGIASQIASQTTAPHIQLKALAGTGKTTSCIEGLKEVKGIATTITPSPQQREFWNALGMGKSDSVRLSAFNSTITDEMKERVARSGLGARGCEAQGVHSMGLRAVTKALGRMDINSAKWVVLDHIADVLGGNFADLKKQRGMMGLMNACDDLVSLCKQNLLEPTMDNLQQLASHYDVETNGELTKIADVVPQVMERCKAPKGRISFDDMIWLPLQLGLPVPKVDLQIIDEAQDLNRMQQELVYKGGHRVVFVGDPHQAIYGFAGADSESMPRMCRTLEATHAGCLTLPLTVTRRCGKAIVREAQRIVPEYEAHESNGEGFVGEAKYPTRGTGSERKEYPWEETYCPLVKDGAMVLCRFNAPLVSECFRFLKRRIKANILGRNIGQGLTALIEKSKAATVEMLRGWIEEWLAKEIDAENKRKFPSENRLMALQDRADCIHCFCEGSTYTSEVVKKINDVFTDSKDKSGVRLSSIHKSKGLEADQVFYLQPSNAPCPKIKSDWQAQQERNLEYVATTRAINELWIVS